MIPLFHSVKLLMKLGDISIPESGINWQNCLQPWAWLLKENPKFNILIVTKFGEIFVTDDSGSIWFLSTSNGSYEKVAESKESFANSLENPDCVEYYFMPKVIQSLEETLGKLNKGQCYGFHVPCIFKECTFEVDNFKIVDIEKYLIWLGGMLGKIQEIPDGTKVSFNVVE